MSERVLITGASGFLGYHIICAAIENELEVYAAVRKTSNIEHLNNLPLQYLFLDYEDVEGMTKMIADNRINYIIHAAGDTKAPTQEVYNLVNATYTANLARAAERSGNYFKKMVFVSSLASIGPLKETGKKITEETTPNPVTAYGRSKLLAEKYLSEFALPTIILRPTAIYGPRDKNIFIVIKMVSKGLEPYIGRMQQALSFVHVRDVADLSVQALFANNKTGAYNVTDGQSYNRFQLADIVKALLHRKATRVHIPMPIVKSLAFFLETVNGWRKKSSVLSREKLHELAAVNWICDISKAKKELGFAPKFDLQNGMEDSIAWYRQNKWL